MQIIPLDPRMPASHFVEMYQHLNSDPTLPEVEIPVNDGRPTMILNDSGDTIVDSLVEPVEE